MKEIKLSGVVIAFNEEAKIERCIRSLQKVCDEVVILDSFSTDNTCKISENLGAKIFQHKFDGHIEQKNRAITYASYTHVLSLDADEELSSELILSILSAKKDWQFDAYGMNRLNNFGGKWIRHGSWYPDKKLRLWKSDKGSWGGENPHDKFIMQPQSRVAHLKGNLLHYTMNGYEDLKSQTDKFSSIASKAMFERGKRVSSLQIVIKTGFRFLKEYFLLLGFLDGKAGWQIASMNATYVWLKYRRLQALRKQNPKQNIRLTS